MLVTLGLTFLILALVMVGACIGLFFKREPIKGSCGGLSAMGIQKACACKEPCDAAKARMEQARLEQESSEQDKNQLTEVKSEDYKDVTTGEGVYKAK